MKQVLMLNKGSGTGSRLCSPTNLVPAWRHVEVALTALFKIWDENENEDEDENTQVTYRDPGSRRIQKQYNLFNADSLQQNVKS